jgi:hypothetical protein
VPLWLRCGFRASADPAALECAPHSSLRRRTAAAPLAASGQVRRQNLTNVNGAWPFTALLCTALRWLPCDALARTCQSTCQRARRDFCTDAKSAWKGKPTPGLEPGTPSLRVTCSTGLSYVGRAGQFDSAQPIVQPACYRRAARRGSRRPEALPQIRRNEAGLLSAHEPTRAPDP